MVISSEVVKHAEELLEQVKLLTSPPTSAAALNHGEQVKKREFEAYQSTHRVEELCIKILQGVLGESMYTLTLAESCHESAALGLVTSLKVPDIIGDGQSNLQELSEATGASLTSLKISLRCLRKHNYFTENVQDEASGQIAYRNNALSDVLRSTHPATLKDAVGFICDEGFKSAGHILDHSLQKSDDGKEKKSGLGFAFNHEGDAFTWLSSQPWRRERMGKAMKQMHGTVNDHVITDYPWEALQSPIVDIGGGIGALEMALCKDPKFSALKFVIFDTPGTVETAIKLWSSLPSEAQARVNFQSGNFLAGTLEESKIPLGQPTYLIRHVLHDWTDDQVLFILRAVKDGMLAKISNDTSVSPTLIVCEMLLQDTSPRFVHTTSIQLLAVNNGITRSEKEMVKLLSEAGFVVKRVHPMRAVDYVIEATPAN